MAAQTDHTLNIIRGKNLVGAATKDDIWLVFEHIDALEALLDEEEEQDSFGAEGWRHVLGVGD